MTQPLRIVIAEDEPLLVEDLAALLKDFGHQVVGTAGTGRELLELCRAHRPDLAVIDIKMPDMDGLEAAERLREECPLPLVVVSAYHDPETIRRAMESYVLAYLVKPIKDGDLRVAVELARRRFDEFDSVRREADGLRQALEDRKLIERAKGLLMKRSGMDEPAAFRRLQQLARQKSQKLVEVARVIVEAEEIYGPS